MKVGANTIVVSSQPVKHNEMGGSPKYKTVRCEANSRAVLVTTGCASDILLHRHNCFKLNRMLLVSVSPACHSR